MSGKRGIIAGVVAILLSGPGCVCCGNKGYGLAYHAAPDCDLPACERNRVYVFAVGGATPGAVAALDTLREELNRKGFAKIATGQTIHTGWMLAQIRKLRVDEPEAVFVVVGADGGASPAVTLAEKAAAEGLPVAGVAVVGEGVRPPSSAGLAGVVIGTSTDDAVTVESLARYLSETALATTAPRVTVEPLEWEYPHAPAMRPTGDPAHGAEWAYLFDEPGCRTRAINESSRTIHSQTSASIPLVGIQE
jgi:hypothetical protein